MSLQVSCQLEETSVALQDTVAQLEQLTVANSRLSAGRGGRHGGWNCSVPAAPVVVPHRADCSCPLQT